MEGLPTLITLLIAMSVASERIVEIIKGMSAFLNKEKSDPREEARRKAYLQILATVAGIAVALLSWPIIIDVIPGGVTVTTILALGLLASGGSGFWNSILSHVTNLKNLKAVELEQVRSGGGRPAKVPEPTEGVLNL